MERAIPVEKFYGKEEICKKKRRITTLESVVPYRCENLLRGPVLIWKVFRKQAEALESMHKLGHGLMTFAFQTGDTRLFLIAHPEVFWHYDQQRSPDQRCSYEVIPENSVCKLYFDLEFELAENPCRDHACIVDKFILLMCFMLRQVFAVVCDRNCVVILDSSSSTKFSFHLIFNIPSVCFLDNSHAGRFVRYVCNEVMTSVTEGSLTKDLQDGPLDVSQLCIFVVKDSKGINKLLCDECVYSRNRHFRLFKSTKKGKNCPLEIWKEDARRGEDDKDIFMASLISSVEGSESTKVLVYEGQLQARCLTGSSTCRDVTNTQTTAVSSPYPKVDEFIKSLISPAGRIYRSIYFSSSNVLVYEIQGYRYCANIRRQHKSNNVKYVVDLAACVYYQKCYDQDCASFRSDRLPLPYTLSFSLSDNSDLDSGSSEGVFTLLDCIEASVNEEPFSPEPVPPQQVFSRFPSFGLADESFSELADFLDC